MRLAYPPGIRSCLEGGTWDVCRNATNGGNYLVVELNHLEDRLAPVDRQLTKQELYVKYKRAEVGDLKYGLAVEGADVTRMEIAPTVLELRLASRRGEGGALLIRLYFTEPEELPGVLLALKLAWKRPGPLGIEEQNGHALAAARRADQEFGTM